MPQQNDAAEFQLLSASAKRFETDYDVTRWAGSPFFWLLGLPIKTKGACYERIFSDWCTEKGLKVEPAQGTDADRVVGGKRTEIKGAMLSKAGTYVFNQIRDQNYEILLCMGMSPHDAHLWAIPKDEAMSRWASGQIKNQHARGKDTGILTVDPMNPPDWIRPHGGTLTAGFDRLQSLTRRI